MNKYPKIFWKLKTSIVIVSILDFIANIDDESDDDSDVFEHDDENCGDPTYVNYSDSDSEEEEDAEEVIE